MIAIERNKLEQVLEALQNARYRSLADKIVDPSITAIKEALAQPEQISSQERVAIVINKGPKIRHYAKLTETGELLADGTNLYTTPPKRPWVGLTGLEQKELMAMSAREAVFATEAKLKELNT